MASEKPFRPMKGDNVKDDLHKLKWPAWISVKIDGIRAVNVDGKLLSNTLKPLPNLFTQRRFSACTDIDGELVCGAPNDANCMQNTSSAVMSKDGEPDVTWYVFDVLGHDDKPYEDRKKILEDLVSMHHLAGNQNIVVLEQRLCNSLEEFLAFEEWALSEGYEGVMYRRAGSIYKPGRSTIREGYLLKVKRMIDGEAVVVGFQQQMKNDNEATIDARGLTKRSTSKEGKTPIDRLGAFICRDLKTGELFNVIGGTMDQRDDWWVSRETLKGKIIRYQSLPTGVVSAPRSPVLGKAFDGFRDPIDITDYDQDWVNELIVKGC